MQKKRLTEVFKKRFPRTFNGFLTNGLNGEKLALSLAFGVTCGTFPMFGVATILCTLAALVLKLNLPAIQLANYLVYPLQIALLGPFYLLGNLLFGAQQSFDLDALWRMLSEVDQQEIITMMLTQTLQAVGAWLLVCPAMLVLLYRGLKPALLRLELNQTRIRSFKR